MRDALCASLLQLARYSAFLLIYVMINNPSIFHAEITGSLIMLAVYLVYYFYGYLHYHYLNHCGEQKQLFNTFVIVVIVVVTNIIVAVTIVIIIIAVTITITTAAVLFALLFGILKLCVGHLRKALSLVAHSSVFK